MSSKQWSSNIHYFLFGFIGPSKKIITWDKCKRDWQKIYIRKTFGNFLISVLSLGLYTPIKISIYCKPPPKISIEEEFEADLP